MDLAIPSRSRNAQCQQVQQRLWADTAGERDRQHAATCADCGAAARAVELVKQTVRNHFGGGRAEAARKPS